MKVGILLSGCGVYDGVEIQEAVLTFLACEEQGIAYQCFAVNKPQRHVIDHTTGKELNESRNMFVEAARIARGNILPIEELHPSDYDGIIIPGGFGSAKNFTSWAFDGPSGTILPEVKLAIVNFMNLKKPLLALCVSPVVIAKAIENSALQASLTLGSTQEESPYSIADFHAGLTQTGVSAVEKTIREIHIDEENNVISAPCYMMNASLLEVRNNISQAIQHFKTRL